MQDLNKNVSCKLTSLTVTSTTSSCMQGGKRLRRTERAGAPLDVTSTRFPWARYEQTILAIACVFPHPGGPSTTTAGAPSDNS